MASIDDLLAQIPIDSIAERLGVDNDTARNAVQTAVPTLLGGLQANAADEKGEAALINALSGHGELLDGGVDVKDVDTSEGAKIVDNVFGENKNDVVHALGATGGGSAGSDLMAKLMPILAPIVLAYVAKQMAGNSGVAAQQPNQQQAQQSSGGGLGDLLGGLLGGNKGGGGSSGGLGGVLGGLLGGNAGGALGNVLGGLLGGGKK